MEGVVRAWLAQQCEMIQGVARGIVLLRPAEGGFPVQAARWPEDESEAPDLAATARSAVVQRQVVVNGANGHGRIAVPLSATPGLSGVVALEIADPSGPEFRGAVDRLRSAATWLGVLARGDVAKDRLLKVTELIGISLEHDSFRAAATAVATELATRLLCDRVSIGFVQRDQMVVEALSHSATFDQRSNLIRDLGLAMDEAADQDSTVAHPAPPDAPPRIERAHEHVARSYGSGSVWTVPVARGRPLALRRRAPRARPGVARRRRRGRAQGQGDRPPARQPEAPGLRRKRALVACGTARSFHDQRKRCRSIA